MAECPSSAEQALEKLNEQLTCSICLDQYKDPKLLHCFHVFCEKCLKPVARQTPQGQVVECPNCRHLTSLPQGGVSGLQGAFLIHHLFDIQDILKKVNAPAGTKCMKCKQKDPICYCRSCGFLCDACKYPHTAWDEFSSHELVSLDQLSKDVTNLVPPAQKSLNCSKHPTKELDIYCETCQEVICQYCVLKVHRDHQLDLATDVFPQQKKMLVSSVEPVEQQLISVKKALEELQSLRGEITSQRQVLETKIRAEIRLGHQALEAREEVLLLQLDQKTQQKLKNVDAQQDQLELVATRLKSCCGFLTDILKTGSQMEILATAKPFLQQVKDVMSPFKPESLKPEEHADLDFLSNQNELNQACQQFGQVTANPARHAECNAKGEMLKLAVVGDVATVAVHIVDQEGREYSDSLEVNCELVSCDGSRKVRGRAKKVKDGHYEVSYLPNHKGPHYLHISVEGKHIPGSPFPVSVITTTPTSIIPGVSKPRGLALNNKGAVACSGHCISVFSGSGERIKSFGSLGHAAGELNAPCGIALSANGDIMVIDQWNHRIQVFSPDGKSVKCIGTKGSGPLQFNLPVGIAVHPHSKKVYIADAANNRVQILHENLTFYKTFGSNGLGNGQFHNPHGVSFDSSGNVYIADYSNHRVQVFTADGEYIRKFENKGSGSLEGIALDSNDLVYVSGSKNNILIFTREGKFLRSFGGQGTGPGQFNRPTGIAVSKDGVVYVSDFNNGRIQAF